MMLSSVTLASAQSTGAFDTVADRFQAATSHWRDTFLTYANGLFWSLVTLDLVWTGIQLALKNADLQEVVSELVRHILLIGFHAALLMNATTWIPAIVDSFRAMGTAANGAAGVQDSLKPSYIFDIALQAANDTISSSLSVFSPHGTILGGLLGLGILIVGALIAATMLVSLCEMYVVLNAGIIMLGFGGSRWTRNYSTSLLNYAVGIGVKLMLIQLIVGLGQTFVAEFSQKVIGNPFSFEETALLLCTMTVLLALIRSLPNIVQAMVTGGTAHLSGTGAVAAAGSVASMAGPAAGAAKAAAGGAMAVASAAKLASAQGATSAAVSGASKAGAMGIGGALQKAAAFTGRAAGNLAKAAGKDMATSLEGKQRAGTMGHRMAASMSQESKSLKSAAAQSAPLASAPTAPPPPPPPSGTKPKI